MAFCDVLKKLRLNNSLSQTDLAEAIGVSKSAISMYENGNREPDFETLEVIADFFNVDMNMLLDRTPSEYWYDPETAKIAQEMHDRPELKTMFKSTRKATPETLKSIRDYIGYTMKKQNGPEPEDVSQDPDDYKNNNE